MPRRYRTVWISDTHLGSKGSRAEELSRFLKHIRCDVLYLVGDIIDMWRLKQRWYWPDRHNEVIRRILTHARHGTEVIYVPGNHDDAARKYFQLQFGGVRIVPHARHVTADGRKLLVSHGDQYDLVVTHSKALSLLGSIAYEWLLTINRVYNGLRARCGRPYISLSQAIKGRVKRACTYISRFEETLLREARRRQMDGVVCGHIHKAEIVTDEHGVSYYNCGDWVESCTALVEEEDGTIHIVDGFTFLEMLDHDQEAEQELARRPTADPELDELFDLSGVDAEAAWLMPDQLAMRR